MKQVCKVFRVEKNLLPKSIREVISSASAERQRGLVFLERVNLCVKIEFVGKTIRVTWAFLTCCTEEMYELELTNSKEVLQRHGQNG